mmetsp:Transcript_9819/g.12434  ORF Transcript_9819/g.12434 Transcript_9819/m.12434 type:complete len:367 (-) Transcript_9819:97-1197(-)
MTSMWKTAVSSIFLFFLILGMSATVDFTHFKTQIMNKKAIGTGIICQFLLLPLLGFVVIKIANLEYVYGITLLIITSSPGGAYSNWFCSIFNADLALSVTMTAISTILSIGMLPLNIFIYSKAAYGSEILDTIDWLGLGITLIVVISAIALGLYSSYKLGTPRFRDIANKAGNLAGFGLILFSFLVPDGGRVTISGRPLIFYIATPLPIVLGLIFSIAITTLAKLKKPERVSVTVECCYQNTGIAITSCLSVFTGDDQREALGVPFFYTGMQTLIVGLYCLLAWKIGWTKAPRNENFFKMIYTTYELEDSDGVGASTAIDVELPQHQNQELQETSLNNDNQSTTDKRETKSDTDVTDDLEMKMLTQ